MTQPTKPSTKPSTKQRSGKERIESLGIERSRLSTWWHRGDKWDFATRVAMVLAATLGVLLICRTWEPPFAYRSGAIPARDLISRATFEVPDEAATEELKKRRMRGALVLYENSPERLAELRAALLSKLFQFMTLDSFEKLGETQRLALAEFDEGSETAGEERSPPARFALFKEVFARDPELKKLDETVATAIAPVAGHGVLVTPQHQDEEGSLRMIRVFTDNPKNAQPVDTSQVRVAEVADDIEVLLADLFRQRFDNPADPGDKYLEVARLVGGWIRRQLPQYETLKYDPKLSQIAREEAAAEVEPVMTTYFANQSKLADGGLPLSAREMGLLRQEWTTLLANMRMTDRLARMAAYGGMLAALALLAGSYTWFVDDRTLLTNKWNLGRLLLLMVVTIGLAYYAFRDQWRTELVPLVIASITMAVVYGRELALLLMAAICLSVTLLLGADLSNLVAMAAACTSCVLLTGRIRTRTHLLFVGCVSAAITMATVVGVGIVTGQTLAAGAPGAALEPMIRSRLFDRVVFELIGEAGWSGVCIVISALVMYGLLPLVERGFQIQTDLSLMELGDASHPLLRRLAQRAPGTYNHSINVASIAEAAADAIGANGLLVRVGAYFHDIGKMFKPEYFIENQSGHNQHDQLQPAMSTLVIIAHVKDGADLARNHHLPQSIIDFILQHHGTTCVEYFYREAAKRSESSPNRESVSDKDFRYPGPKPQTLESAVLMLSDTVESASRSLVDPTPARIQHLVDSIAQKKVADGQFDECGLTFTQLHRIRTSLVKSLTANYHSRIKYPGQQSA